MTASRMRRGTEPESNVVQAVKPDRARATAAASSLARLVFMVCEVVRVAARVKVKSMTGAAPGV